MVWYGMVWYGMVWYGMVLYVLTCSMSLFCVCDSVFLQAVLVCSLALSYRVFLSLFAR